LVVWLKLFSSLRVLLSRLGLRRWSGRVKEPRTVPPVIAKSSLGAAGRLAGVDDWADLWLWLESLQGSRRVFHSEADFQHALALAIAASDPGVRVRLETRPLPGMRLDLLVSRPDLGGHLAVELKYLPGGDTGEHFQVLGQGAQDIQA
jgi:hypothetical protein